MIPSRRAYGLPVPGGARGGSADEVYLGDPLMRVIVEGGVHAEFWQIHLILGIEHRHPPMPHAT
jgi:hypothetical protein